MAMQCIRNGNQHSPPELGVNVVKIVVVGEPNVGKSSFIRSFYAHHEPGEVDSHNGVRVYPCEFVVEQQYWRAAIFEIPGDPDFFRELRTAHYNDAKVIVLMYAIDDPSSFDQLTDKWLPEARDYIELKGIPVMLVGSKRDLRDNQLVIERLALGGKIPVTDEQGSDLLVYEEIRGFAEVSTDDLEEVNRAFDIIFKLAVY